MTAAENKCAQQAAELLANLRSHAAGSQGCLQAAQDLQAMARDGAVGRNALLAANAVEICLAVLTALPLVSAQLSSSVNGDISHIAWHTFSETMPATAHHLGPHSHAACSSCHPEHADLVHSVLSCDVHCSNLQLLMSLRVRELLQPSDPAHWVTARGQGQGDL